MQDEIIKIIKKSKDDITNMRAELSSHFKIEQDLEGRIFPDKELKKFASKIDKVEKGDLTVGLGLKLPISTEFNSAFLLAREAKLAKQENREKKSLEEVLSGLRSTAERMIDNTRNRVLPDIAETGREEAEIGQEKAETRQEEAETIQEKFENICREFPFLTLAPKGEEFLQNHYAEENFDNLRQEAENLSKEIVRQLFEVNIQFASSKESFLFYKNLLGSDFASEIDVDSINIADIAVNFAFDCVKRLNQLPFGKGEEEDQKNYLSYLMDNNGTFEKLREIVQEFDSERSDEFSKSLEVAKLGLSARICDSNIVTDLIKGVQEADSHKTRVFGRAVTGKDKVNEYFQGLFSKQNLFRTVISRNDFRNATEEDLANGLALVVVRSWAHLKNKDIANKVKACASAEDLVSYLNTGLGGSDINSDDKSILKIIKHFIKDLSFDRDQSKINLEGDKVFQKMQTIFSAQEKEMDIITKPALQRRSGRGVSVVGQQEEGQGRPKHTSFRDLRETGYSSSHEPVQNTPSTSPKSGGAEGEEFQQPESLKPKPQGGRGAE